MTIKVGARRGGHGAIIGQRLLVRLHRDVGALAVRVKGDFHVFWRFEFLADEKNVGGQTGDL